MKRILILAAVAALTVGGVAHADKDKTDKCQRLQVQYDKAEKSHIAAKTLAKANENRRSGGDLCSKGKREQGIEDLKNALQKIGVKPAK